MCVVKYLSYVSVATSSDFEIPKRVRGKPYRQTINKNIKPIWKTCQAISGEQVPEGHRNKLKRKVVIVENLNLPKLVCQFAPQFITGRRRTEEQRLVQFRYRCSLLRNFLRYIFPLSLVSKTLYSSPCFCDADIHQSMI